MPGGRGRRLPLVSRNRHERPPNTDMSDRMRMVSHRSTLAGELYDDDKNRISFEMPSPNCRAAVEIGRGRPSRR